MPDYLIIILCITAILISLITLYGFVVLRRIHIVAKKTDYLIEDLTYKSEMISPLIGSLTKLSTYVDVMDEIVRNNTLAIKKVTNDNARAIEKYKKQLEKIINEA